MLSFLCLGFFHQSDKRARLGWGHLVARLRLPGQQVSAGHLGKWVFGLYCLYRHPIWLVVHCSSSRLDFNHVVSKMFRGAMRMGDRQLGTQEQSDLSKCLFVHGLNYLWVSHLSVWISSKCNPKNVMVIHCLSLIHLGWVILHRFNASLVFHIS